MTKAKPSTARSRLRELEAENEELRETLRAIQAGEIDALVMGDDAGNYVFTLESAEQPYRELVEAMGEGAATISLDGLILYCNPKFASMTGRPAGKVVGTMADGLFRFVNGERCRKVLERARNSGPAREVVRTARVGADLTVQFSVSEVPIGDVTGFCLVITDLSERLRIEDQLRELNEGLEKHVGARTADLREAVDSLRRSEEQFRRLADSIPQLAWMAGPDGNVFWYNQRWYEYTGTDEDQMRGDGWRRAYHPAIVDEFERAWAASVSAGTAFEMTFPLRGRDGLFRSFLTRGTPVRDQDDVIVKWFGTNTDIEETLRAQREIQLAKIAAEHANETKSAFLANMSHEIRTPLGR